MRLIVLPVRAGRLMQDPDKDAEKCGMAWAGGLPRSADHVACNPTQNKILADSRSHYIAGLTAGATKG
jgi:hypothetical protein